MLLRVLTRSAWSPPKSHSDAEADRRHDRHPLQHIERAMDMSSIIIILIYEHEQSVGRHV